MFIPFGVGNTTVPLTISDTGAASDVFLASFGSHSAAGYSLTNGQFILPAGEGHQHAFMLPCPAKVKRIAVNFTNAAAFDAPSGTRIYPYVVLAVAPPASNIFTILAESETPAGTPWIGGFPVPEGAVLSGFFTDIDVAIPENSRIAICCALKAVGTPVSQSYAVYYSGGILLA